MALLNPIICGPIFLNNHILTFHYGAIKPLAQEMLMANADKLTFHYGAIKPKNE